MKGFEIFRGITEVLSNIFMFKSTSTVAAIYALYGTVFVILKTDITKFIFKNHQK